MIKRLFIPIIVIAIVLISCKDGFTDEITRVEPAADESDPSITLINPTGTVFIPFTDEQTDLPVVLRVEDDIEIVSISVELDGASLATYSEEDFLDYRRFEETIVVEALEVGDHSLTVSSSDASGKTSNASIDFEVTNEYVPQSGEIFYMAFEGGEFKDIISEEVATSNGNPGTVDGVFGDAVEFNAENTSYIVFPANDAIQNLTSFTLSFWSYVDFVDSDDSGGIDGVLGLVNLSHTSRFWGNIDVFIENNSNPVDGADMRLHITNTLMDASASETWITDANDRLNVFNTWSNHVITYDDASKQFTYYINASVATSATASWTEELTFGSAGQLVMGCVQFQTDPSSTSATGSQAWASYLTGELDEVKIFNKSLTSGEVEALYNSTAPQ